VREIPGHIQGDIQAALVIGIDRRIIRLIRV
jgi:hypothetical protein